MSSWRESRPPYWRVALVSPLSCCTAGSSAAASTGLPCSPTSPSAIALIVPDVPGQGKSEPIAQLDSASFGAWLTCADRVDVRGEAAPRRALPSGQPRRAVRGAARRCAPQGGDLRDPGRWAFRLPPGLMVAALLFDLRPSERNMDRFARWAFLDPDLTRSRDPEWLEAFDAYNLTRARRPARQANDAAPDQDGTKRVPDAELQRIAVPDRADLGAARPDGASARRRRPQARSTAGRLHVIEDAGHVPHIEQPDAFLGALRPALETLTGEEAQHEHEHDRHRRTRRRTRQPDLGAARRLGLAARGLAAARGRRGLGRCGADLERHGGRASPRSSSSRPRRATSPRPSSSPATRAAAQHQGRRPQHRRHRDRRAAA